MTWYFYSLIKLNIINLDNNDGQELDPMQTEQIVAQIEKLTEDIEVVKLENTRLKQQLALKSNNSNN